MRKNLLIFFKQINTGSSINNNFHKQVIETLKNNLKEDNLNNEHILNNQISSEEILNAVKTFKMAKQRELTKFQMK